VRGFQQKALDGDGLRAALSSERFGGSPAPSAAPSVAVLGLFGVLMPTASIFSMLGFGTSVRGFIQQLNEATYEYDCLLEPWAGTRYEESSRLTQIKGVGTLTALTFMLTVGDKARFSRTRDIGPYLGLRPRLGQSGDNEPQLRITKAGDGLLRKTLVECAQYMVGPFGQDSDLRRWGLKMIEAGNGSKRARQRAVVGVARRLAVLLMSLWKSGQSYDPLRHSRAQEVVRR
jgi:hypothetical protein